MNNIPILRLAGTSHMDEQVVLQPALMRDIPIQAVMMDFRGDHAEALRAKATLPVGPLSTDGQRPRTWPSRC